MRVIDFVAPQVGVATSKIKSGTRLFHDLGVDGDDGVEFMEAFCKHFQVDPSTIQIDKHFGPESAAMPWTIIWWVFSPSCRRGDGFLPIRIRDLVESAQTGKWSVVYDDGMEPRAPRDAKDRNALF